MSKAWWWHVLCDFQIRDRESHSATMILDGFIDWHSSWIIKTTSQVVLLLRNCFKFIVIESFFFVIFLKFKLYANILQALVKPSSTSECKSIHVLCWCGPKFSISKVKTAWNFYQAVSLSNLTQSIPFSWNLCLETMVPNLSNISYISHSLGPVYLNELCKNEICN